MTKDNVLNFFHIGKVFFIRRGQTSGGMRTVQFINVDNLKNERPMTIINENETIEEGCVPFIISRKGGALLVHEDYLYRSNMKRQGREKNIIYWECVANRKIKCRGRVKTVGNTVINTSAEGRLFQLALNKSKNSFLNCLCFLQ